MLRNFFLVTIRNLFRNKTFSVINILGLSLGMASSLLIFLWVHDEQSMNSFLRNRRGIYGVYERVFSEGKIEAGHWTPGLLATELKRKIPGIKYASGYWNRDEEMLFSAGNKNFSLKGCYADSDFFKIFSYKLLQGTAASVLTSPDDIAISRRMATDFFGSPEAAFGKSIRYNNTKDFKVAAVFEDLPSGASEKFDYVLNWPYVLTSIDWLKDWINRSPATFITLQPHADPVTIEAQLKNFITPYLGHYGTGYRLELGLQRFDEMYLNSTFKNGVPDGGRIEYVRLFSLIAVFILLIACINFMNLATARSVKRAKEVGVRKTVGALRTGLFFQFIGEAVLLAALAFLLALFLVLLVLPLFNRLTGKEIILPAASPAFWLSAAGLLLVTGFIAGSYPALFLSSLNPVKVLKGSLKFSPGALLFRKSLVVFQFVLSIVLIIATIIVAQQVSYVQTKNLGFNKENLVYLPFQGDLGTQAKFNLFKQQLTGMAGIKGVTTSTQAPSHIGAHVYDVSWDGKNPNDKLVAIHNGIGYDYLDLMNLKMVLGRGFSRAFASDSSHRNPHFIINETLWKLTGYKDPLGKRITFFGTSGTIIGVVKDFNLGSLHDPFMPLVLYWGEDAGWGYTLVKTEPGKTREALASMETVFKQMEPRFPFRYYFADEEYRKLYNNEQTISKLCDSFSFLAIFLSCLGLLGLAMFTAEQRTKEIGVRKIIGARVGDIVMMLSGDIVRLVIIASVIATPISWLAMNQWLRGFAFRIQISWWVFLLAGVLTLLIAMLTISYQAIKTALANPIKSLRTE